MTNKKTPTLLCGIYHRLATILKSCKNLFFPFFGQYWSSYVQPIDLFYSEEKGNHLSRSYSDTNLVQESCPFQNFQGWSMRQWLNQEELWKQDLSASDVFFGTRFMRAPNKEAPFFTTWRICLWYFDINTNTRCHCFRYFFLFVSVSALYVTQLSIIMKHIQIKNI